VTTNGAGTRLVSHYVHTVHAVLSATVGNDQPCRMICHAKLRLRGSITFGKLLQLHLMRQNDPTAKALVFSQFVGTIEWLKVKLEEQGFGYRTISGSMSLQQRSKVISALSAEPSSIAWLIRSANAVLSLLKSHHQVACEAYTKAVDSIACLEHDMEHSAAYA